MQYKEGFARLTMSNKIRHAGIIDSIEETHVRVKIVQASACASCKVASRCNASESKEKIIDVYTDTSGLSVGQSVIVNTSHSTANRAVMIGFVLPLLLLMGVLLTLKATGYREEIAALCAMGILIPYYICIWLLRGRIAKSISFELEK